MKLGEIIGVGKTAVVYKWDEGRVLKLFNEGYSKRGIEKEFSNAKALNHMSFDKPIVYDIIQIGNQTGIVYDKVEGESLLDWLLKTNDIQMCAVLMAKLHEKLLKNTIENVPDYKEFLEQDIKSAQQISKEVKKEALLKLKELPNGNTLCHGDFHPGNILYSNGKTTVIDFMNVCHGDFLYDIARTVFLIEYSPVPEEIIDKKEILQTRKNLTDIYIKHLGVDRENLQPFLSVITIARIGECPEK